MSERQTEQKAEKRDAMGCLLVSRDYGPIDFDKYCYMQTLGVRPKKENPTETETFVEKLEKIDDMVANAAKTVGLNVALEQIAKGLVPPDAYIDDGQGFIDDTVTPETRAEFMEMAAQNKALNDAIRKEYGENATAENIEQLINDKIAAALAAQTKTEGDKQ